MKRGLLWKFGILLFIVLLLSIPANASPGDYLIIPDEVNGLPVIFVETETNTEWLSSGEVVLVLLDSSSKSPEESFVQLKFDEYLSANPLPPNWTFTVVGGEKTSRESFTKSHQEVNAYIAKNGPFVRGAPGMIPNGTLDVQTHPSFAIFKDTDPAWYWFQTITGMRARWYAPAIGTSQTYYSALMVNGLTNGTNYRFIQVGQVFGTDGQGVNGWASSHRDGEYDPYELRPFDNVRYYQDNYCEFILAYGGPSFGWWTSAQDFSGQQYQWAPAPGVDGDKLVEDNSTGIFFENHNNISGWYSDFTNPIRVVYAEDFNGSWKAWNHEAIVIVDPYGYIVPNNGKITGNLVGYNSAYWHLELLLLGVVY